MARKKRELFVPRLVAVEGPLGVGKSAFIARWAERLPARRIELDPAANPFLDDIYARPSRRVFSAQMYFLLARYRQQLELRQGELFAPHAVCDGLFQRDRIYAEVLLSEAEMRLYERIYRLLEGRAVVPDLLVLLRARPEILLERLRARGLRREQAIRLETVDRLVTAYASYFDNWKSSPVVSIDVSRVDLAEQDDAAETAVSEVRRLSAQLQKGERVEIKPTSRG